MGSRGNCYIAWKGCSQGETFFLNVLGTQAITTKLYQHEAAYAQHFQMVEYESGASQTVPRNWGLPVAASSGVLNERTLKGPISMPRRNTGLKRASWAVKSHPPHLQAIVYPKIPKNLCFKCPRATAIAHKTRSTENSQIHAIGKGQGKQRQWERNSWICAEGLRWRTLTHVSKESPFPLNSFAIVIWGDLAEQSPTQQEESHG